jgi:hypothetical protein
MTATPPIEHGRPPRLRAQRLRRAIQKSDRVKKDYAVSRGKQLMYFVRDYETGSHRSKRPPVVGREIRIRCGRVCRGPEKRLMISDESSGDTPGVSEYTMAEK